MKHSGRPSVVQAPPSSGRSKRRALRKQHCSLLRCCVDSPAVCFLPALRPALTVLRLRLFAADCHTLLQAVAAAVRSCLCCKLSRASAAGPDRIPLASARPHCARRPSRQAAGGTAPHARLELTLEVEPDGNAAPAALALGACDCCCSSPRRRRPECRPVLRNAFLGRETQQAESTSILQAQKETHAGGVVPRRECRVKMQSCTGSVLGQTPLRKTGARAVCWSGLIV